MYLILFQNLIKKYKSFIGSSFIVALIAFLSSLPIVLNNFYEFNLLSIILNILYVPFVSFILFPLSLICFILPFFDKLLFILTNVLESSSIIFSNIKTLTFIIGKPSIMLIMLYYISITILLINIKYIYLLPILIIINKISYYTITPTIEFIDVGQGDSILIRLNNDKDILIDTGGILKYESNFKFVNEFSIGNDVLVPYLKSIGIDDIDYLFITHGDMDHIGGSYDLVNKIDVKNIYLNGSINELEERLLLYNPIYLKEKDTLTIGNAIIRVLNPYKETNENDSSIVLYIEINGYKTLLMGDASKVVEEYIINNYDLDIDILKLGHHGSKTSTSDIFIKNINLKYGIISVGENNRFKHPNKEVLDILNKYNVNIYRTDECGSIRFKLKDKLLINTRRCYER